VCSSDLPKTPKPQTIDSTFYIEKSLNYELHLKVFKTITDVYSSELFGVDFVVELVSWPCQTS
jgi:hypothetical protein